MKWVLIAIFCFSSASAALLGSNRCTWGPAYWCQGLETAKKCNAVPHCVRMWKGQPSTSVSSTETCLICKGVIEDLKTLIANKKTQEEIKELAGKVCDLMKNEKTAYEVCNTVAVLYLPEVLQMIESEIDSGVICKMLHLCDSSKLAKKLNRVTEVLQKVKMLKTSSSCDECKLAVSMLKSYLSDNATQQELIQFVDQKVCPALPGDLKTFCKTFVANEMPQMLKSLEEILDPNTICAMIGVCPKVSHKSLVRSIIAKFMKNQKFRANGVECQLCQAGIKDIRNTLSDASIQKQIETFLKTEVCTHLGSLEITCQQGVAQYLPLAMKLLVQELDPAAVCQELKLCTATKQPVMKLSPAKTRVRMPRASAQCVVCEFVMTKVEALIGTNRSEAAITSALEKVCDIMPQTVRAECDNFVATYAPQVIKILVAEITPGRVCSVIGLCAGETENLHVVRRHNPATCNLMVRYLHVLAKELHMSLKDVVHKVCNFLPRNERPACREFVADHKHRILRMKKSDFVVKFHPTRMCQKLQGHRRRRPTGLVQLLGRSKCTYGPAYWCATLVNAQECGAISHCRQHVWPKTGGLL